MATPLDDSPLDAVPFAAGVPLCVAWSDGGTGPFAMLASGHSDGRILIRNADAPLQHVATTLDGHTGWVRSVGFNGDGTRIASGSDDWTVRVWNADTGKQLHQLDGHTGRVVSVGFNRDGTRIVSGSDDWTVRVWDAHTGKQLHQLDGHTDAVLSVGYSGDGTRIVSGSDDRTVRVWNAHTGKQLHQLDGHTGRVVSVGYSGDGTRIVSGSDDWTVRVWNAATGKQLHQLDGHTDSVVSVGFNRDGTRILSGSGDRTVRVWNPDTGRQVHQLDGHTDSVWAVGFSGDGTRIVSGSDDGTVRVWNAATGKLAHRLDGHTGWVWSVGYNGDGTRIVSSGNDRTVRVWDADTGRQVHQLDGHTDSVWAVGFSGDGTRIVSGSKDGTVRVWAAPGRQVHQLDGHTGRVLSVGFNGDGTHIVSGSGDATVRVWDADTGRQLHQLDGHTGWVWSVGFNGDGTRIVSGSGDATVRVWDAESGKQLHRLHGHTDSVLSVGFNGDGTHIVSGSNDKTVRVWNTGLPDGGETPHSLEFGAPVTSVAWRPEPTAPGRPSPGGGTLAVWGGWIETVTLSTDGVDRRPFPRATPTPLTWPDDWPDGRTGDAPGVSPPLRRSVDTAATADDQPAHADLLSRTPLARWIATTLDTLTRRVGTGAAPTNNDFMLVLDAPWGSGKTTLVNLVCQDLAGESPEPGDSAAEPQQERQEWVIPNAAYDAWRRAKVGPTWWSLVSWLREVAIDQTPRGPRRWWFRVREAWARVRHGRSTWATLAAIALVAAVALAVFAAGWRLSAPAQATAIAPEAATTNTTAAPSTQSTTPTVAAAPVAPVSPTASDVSDVSATPEVAAAPSTGTPANERALDSITTTRTVVEAVAAIAAVMLAAWFVTARIILWYSPLGARLLQRRDANPMDEIVEHARWLRQQLRGPLLWVIDDLDRCDADQVVDLLEAVQTVLRAPEASGLPTWKPSAEPLGQPKRRDKRAQPLVFVVAADARWISQAFEHRHRDAHAPLGEPGRTLGSLFLDKLFQLRITLPTPSTEDLDRYDRITLNLPDAPTVEPPEPPPAAAGDPEAQPEANSAGPSSPVPAPERSPSSETSPGAASTVDPPEAAAPDATTLEATKPAAPGASATGEAPTAATPASAPTPFPPTDRLHHIIETERYRDVVDWWDQLPAEHKSPELDDAMAERDAQAAASGEADHLLQRYMSLVEPNPRTRKRLVNTWSANTAALRGLRTIDSDHLVRWSIIDIRWPDFARALRDNPELIDRVGLPAHTGDPAAPDRATRGNQTGDEPDHDPWGSTLRSDELRRIVQVPATEQGSSSTRLSGADLRTLLGLPERLPG